PGADPTRAAKAAEAREHGPERVVGRLAGDVVELVAAQLWQARSSPCDLEARGTKKQRVQAGDPGIPDRPLGTERDEPVTRLRVERASCEWGRCDRRLVRIERRR